MMRKSSCGPAAADARGGRRLVAAVLLALSLAGCGRGEPSGSTASVPPKPPAVILPLDEAVVRAADDLFASATPAAAAPAGERVVVIDPLIDGASGAQSIATRSMEARIIERARERHPGFAFAPFSSSALARAQLALLGSVTSVDGQGVPAPAAASGSYRVWLVLADLRSGTVVGRGVAHARLEDVDATPLAHFRDSPAQASDRSIQAYLQGCGSPIGAKVDPVYLDGVVTAAVVSDAIVAYDGGRYREALDLYRTAAVSPGGDQLRVHNGVYLANMRLGRAEDAAAAFDGLVDYGFRQRRLAVKFLFRTGSSAFVPDQAVSGAYEVWLQRIARRAARGGACLETVGHTSATGSAALNDRLSLLRARYVQARLEQEAPELKGRLTASGVGSRETIVGTGTDDAADALDRRVEFKLVECGELQAAVLL